MKYILYILTFFILTTPVYANRKAGLKATDISVFKTGNELIISFRLNIDKNATKRGEKLIILPTLQDSNQRKNLIDIEISNRKAQIIDYRKELSLSKRNRQNTKQVFTATNGENLQYYITIPFEPWMARSVLSLNMYYQSCCETDLIKPDTLSNCLNLSQNFKPRFSEYDNLAVEGVNGEEFKKWDFAEESPKINFIQGKTDIDLNYLDNKESLNKIASAIQTISSNPYNKFKSIEISGFASPEGDAEYNSALSTERAFALKQYILQVLPELNENSFMLRNGHENWAELRTYIENSKMPQKKDLLNILDNTKPLDGLKDRLKNYQSGYAYMYLVHNYFPLLRNACSLSIYYTTPIFNYNENIESGLTYIKEKKYAKALSLLISEKENPLIWNHLGICFMMTNNWDEAKKYFQKAIKMGSTDALINLEMIE